MRRLSPHHLLDRIAIKLRIQRGPDKRKLGIAGDYAAETVARAIVDECLGGCVVLAPDMMPAGDYGERQGKFGLDEPWPFEKGHQPPRPRVG